MELHTALACAYVRGAMPEWAGLDEATLLERGRAEGLPLHRFKRTAALPRVARVLGHLQGLEPTSILDLGSGRGVFLWPLLEAVRGVAITAVDKNPHRVRDIDRVARGGVLRLAAVEADLEGLPFEDLAFDVVTALEVLEHLERPERAAREIVRVARRFAVVSVPSRADDNPEHIQLFHAPSLTSLFLDAGASRVDIDWVPGHMIGVVNVGRANP